MEIIDCVCFSQYEASLIKLQKKIMFKQKFHHNRNVFASEVYYIIEKWEIIIMFAFLHTLHPFWGVLLFYEETYYIKLGLKELSKKIGISFKVARRYNVEENSLDLIQDV